MGDRMSQRRWRSFSLVLMLLGCLNDTHGFLSLPCEKRTNPYGSFHDRTTTTWLQAKFGRAAGDSAKKKAKKTGPTYGKIKKTKQQDDKRLKLSSLSSEAQSKNSTPKAAARPRSLGLLIPSSKSKSPPWQVLSTKEAHKNVEAERKRREMAKLGLESSDDEVDQSTGRNEASESSKTIVSKTLLSDTDRQLVNWKRFNPSTTACGMTFIGAYLDKRLPPRLGVPEIAFLGRSNVGKSSLLNKLASTGSGGGGGDGARVGKTPGATASVNLYAMLGKNNNNNNKQSSSNKAVLGLVDLPGFGYAKLSKEVQEAVQLAAERYLGSRDELALGILLVDARRIPSEDDCAVLAALYDLGLSIVVVATKIDKLTKQELETSKQIICDRLGLPPGQPLCVSSVTGEGTRELWKIIMEACEIRVDEIKDRLERRTGTVDDDDDEGAVELDDFGNPVLSDFTDNDDDDLSYDQGYDWIQGSAVMYAYGNGEANGRNEPANDLYYEDEDSTSDPAGTAATTTNSMQQSEVRVTFKALKKMARKMEERGEV